LAFDFKVLHLKYLCGAVTSNQAGTQGIQGLDPNPGTEAGQVQVDLLRKFNMLSE